MSIWNGGSDLDNGQSSGSQGSPVADGDEETVGAYLLVNWDDDDADGAMNADGTWSALPVPDLTENFVVGEDNLAKLRPSVEPLLSSGTVELEVSGADAGKIKLWMYDNKGLQVTLSSNKKTWNLADSEDRSDLEWFMTNGYWIEGTDTGSAERAVTFTMRYKNSGGSEVAKDVCKATVVMINLGNAVYRDADITGASARGHSALVWRYSGSCTATDLADDTKFLIIEMDGPTDTKTLATMTQYTGAPSYGCFTNPSITCVQRLRILAAARALVSREAAIGYQWNDAALPEDWDGHLDTIVDLRCDGLVEVCYEVNGVDVWGMERDPDSSTVHYPVNDQGDNWNYNESLGTWSAGANSKIDNLEEHNDFDTAGWADTLMPATQCGHVTPEDADTEFQQQDLCLPTGSKGGN